MAPAPPRKLLNCMRLGVCLGYNERRLRIQRKPAPSAIRSPDIASPIIPACSLAPVTAKALSDAGAVVGVGTGV